MAGLVNMDSERMLLPALVLYGAYVVIFFQSGFALLTQRRAGFQSLLAASIILFILTTISIGSNIFTVVTFEDTASVPPSLTKLNAVIPVLAFVAADAILIRKCFLIWESRLIIIALPCFLLLTSTALGLAATVVLELYIPFFALALVTNLLLTGLSAYRIWSVSQASYLGDDVKQKYMMAFNMLLECGGMYCVILFVLLIIGAATYAGGNYATGYSSILMIAAQFAAILPTLSIARSTAVDESVAIPFDPSSVISSEIERKSSLKRNRRSIASFSSKDVVDINNV